MIVHFFICDINLLDCIKSISEVSYVIYFMREIGTSRPYMDIPGVAYGADVAIPIKAISYFTLCSHSSYSLYSTTTTFN